MAIFQENYKKSPPERRVIRDERIGEIKKSYLEDPDNFNMDDWVLGGIERWQIHCFIKTTNNPSWQPEWITGDDEEEEDSLAEFEFSSINGIGPTTETNIREHLKSEGITNLRDILECNLTNVTGMGNLTIRRLYAKIQEATEEPYLFELPD